jgi:hypothetical protein
MEFIIGILIFIADVYAIVQTIRAPGASTGAKVLWVLLILILPLIGLIIWFFAGPKPAKTV